MALLIINVFEIEISSLLIDTCNGYWKSGFKESIPKRKAFRNHKYHRLSYVFTNMVYFAYECMSDLTILVY
jgi:hypothetical protein